MRLRHLPLALAAASLVATPTLAASANPAASLSVATSARAGTAAQGTSKLATSGATYALFGFLAFVAAVVIINEVGGDDSDSN